MKIESQTYINELLNLTEGFLQKVEVLKTQPLDKLNYKVDSETWSVLETLEHLNLYGDFYIPEINSRMDKSRFLPEKIFKSGVLGGYFVNILKPRPKLNTMKTLKDKNPNGSRLDKQTLDRFINQQKQMMDLLENAKGVDLTKTKTAISISKWIKLRLGDTLGVVVYHNQRHIEQVDRALKNAQLK